MWKSHYSLDTNMGHYDMWQPIYSDSSLSNPVDPSTVATTDSHGPTSTTPCVSLLRKKGHLIHPSPHYLHNRPFSPFSGYYEENDVYLGCEYDVFGSEPMIIPNHHHHHINNTTTAISSSSITTTKANNDPFLACTQNNNKNISSSPTPILNLNHHQHQHLKRSRNDRDIDQVNTDKRQRTNNFIIPMDDVKKSPSSSIHSLDSFNSSFTTTHSMIIMNDNQLEYC
ncbi:hypothetical protein BJ944DRAFT_273901 [Cunninghamella echinulata]|nr:hypothetical protein BJ944DRAFT_273901 [Cunninghamella echinulata]